MGNDIVSFLSSGLMALFLLYIIYEVFIALSKQSPGFGQMVGGAFVLALFGAAVLWAKKGT